MMRYYIFCVFYVQYFAAFFLCDFISSLACFQCFVGCGVGSFFNLIQCLLSSRMCGNIRRGN